MVWPTVTINTTHMDAPSDDASQARPEIKQMADNLNGIKDAKGAPLGVAELDASGLLPLAQLPTAAVNKGGTNQTSYTVGDILYASAAGVLSKLAASTLGYVLTSNGPGVAPSWQLAGGGLTSGVRMLFQNSTAPVGWTKETNSAYNNVALRIVTGSVSSGGADDFSAVFGVGKTTDSMILTTSHMPAHNHPLRTYTGSFAGGVNRHMALVENSGTSAGTTAVLESTANSGSGSSFTIGISNFDLKYRDFILAQKD